MGAPLIDLMAEEISEKDQRIAELERALRRVDRNLSEIVTVKSNGPIGGSLEIIRKVLT